MIAAISNYLSPLARMNPIENSLFPYAAALGGAALHYAASLADRTVTVESRNTFIAGCVGAHLAIVGARACSRWLKAAELNHRLAKWVAEQPNDLWKERAAEEIRRSFQDQHPRLNLAHLSLRSFPDCAAFLTHLKILDLKCNDLRSLPNLSHLTELSELNLYSNRFASIPNHLARLPSGCRVDARSNELSNELLRQFQERIEAERQISDGQLGPIFYADYNHEDDDHLAGIYDY